MRFLIIFTAYLSLLLVQPSLIIARTTPDGIIKENQQVFENRVAKYTLTHQQQLKDLTTKIAAVNKEETDKLEQIIVIQGLILDEYQRRNLTPDRINTQTKYHTPNDALAQDGIEKARYWITYAHEAVAYQAAKVYIINLTTEANIKTDSRSTINQLKADLEIARQKVFNSQKTLKGAIK